MSETTDCHVKLTAKQALFVREYLVDLNATQAAARAGYSPETAYAIGAENLTKPHIAEAIGKLMAHRSKKLDITGERVLQELAAIAFASMGDFIGVTPDGLARVDLSNIDRWQARAIVCLTSDARISEDGEVIRTQVRLANKVAALTTLAKYLGLLNGNADAAIPKAQLIIRSAPMPPGEALGA